MLIAILVGALALLLLLDALKMRGRLGGLAVLPPASPGKSPGSPGIGTEARPAASQASPGKSPGSPGIGTDARPAASQASPGKSPGSPGIGTEARPAASQADAPVAPDHRFVVAEGVTLDAATKRAASAWARAEGLDVVDLVPGDLPAIRAMSFAQLADPRAFRRARLAPGRTAGHALLVSTAVTERAGIPVETVDEVALIRLAARLKRYASATMDHVVAPAERAAPADLRRRRAALRAVLGPATPVAILVQLAVWALLGVGVWLAPIPGAIALAIWHLQPLVAIAGTSVRARDLAVVTLLRAPIELYVLLRTLAGGWRPAVGPDPVEARRPTYDRLLAGGTDKFWERRRETCPICESGDLAVHLRVRDLLQHKPGRFTLERCRGCGHVFQNPRLSLAGLDFYYKDFYDGLGEAGLEFIFGASDQQYRDRARMVREAAEPARWLDVGAGHGHFCCAARDELPATRFDGLDLSESIDEARRRGWIDASYRGLFPELAPTIAGAYDAVSMSHYLEHTLDPARELDAARTALAPDGLLMIELPDPDFALGKVLGRWWLPWFQPQHLHLLSVKNLEQLLRARGFEPLAWHRGAAHQRVDFTFAIMLALGRLAPPPDVPWRTAGALARARRAVVWTAGAPLLVLGWLADRVAAPLIRRGRVSNTYRVLARRHG